MDAERVGQMADEIAVLMAERFGGLKRGAHADLDLMLRRRGGALPRPLRREAKRLAETQRLAGSARIARQIDQGAAERAHAALVRHLRPLGKMSRAQHRATNIAATVLFGLLLLGAFVLWMMVRRGLV
ncbi:hypothetical protein GI374_08645 [Paracoccus sp. S-4012]|uniref:hypothetical protein n=1 Tax=Paracoccus sp. S-4012 TaxID=2665648 RepID=UPI0012AF31A5|nr:hypothetical protein [Paracoccus sp. S-4012]MRX50508.1 hypothetical protein [Paracoccus sp. S-4012]